MHQSKIQKLVHHRDIYPRWTWSTMPAVCALAGICMRRSSCKYRCIVLLLLGGCLIGDRRINMPDGIKSSQNTGDSRPCKRIMDALYRSQGYSER